MQGDLETRKANIRKTVRSDLIPFDLVPVYCGWPRSKVTTGRLFVLLKDKHNHPNESHYVVVMKDKKKWQIDITFEIVRLSFRIQKLSTDTSRSLL